MNQVVDETRLELRGISKRYGSVLAVNDVSMAVRPGEIHALLGENGAGKSTLLKIVYGVTAQDQGSVIWNGQEVTVASPRDAKDLGIAMVFQHFSLFDSLTVRENVALALRPEAFAENLNDEILATAERFGLDVEPDRLVHSLSVGERQRVELLRAMLVKPRLLILDEPTSVLTPQAVKKLFHTIRQLASEGCSVLYVSHKLHEIQELCHSATVLRGGCVTGNFVPSEETAASMSRMMIGADMPPATTRTPVKQNQAIGLQVARLSTSGSHLFATALQDINFSAHGGEVVGIAGISGNGQAELLAALSGEDRRIESGTVLLNEKPIERACPAERRRAGLAFVPEERLGRGAVPELSLADNLLLSLQDAPYVSRGFINRSALRETARRIINQLSVRTSGPAAPAQSLSGGNLQKFIVGREISRVATTFIFSQPTWGVDVGSAAQLHEQILALKEKGHAVLVISEEIDELFTLCDRLYVIAKGRLSPSVDAQRVSREQIGLWMSGLWESAEQPAPQELGGFANA